MTFTLTFFALVALTALDAGFFWALGNKLCNKLVG